MVTATEERPTEAPADEPLEGRVISPTAPTANPPAQDQPAEAAAPAPQPNTQWKHAAAIVACGATIGCVALYQAAGLLGLAIAGGVIVGLPIAAYTAHRLGKRRRRSSSARGHRPAASKTSRTSRTGGLGRKNRTGRLLGGGKTSRTGGKTGAAGTGRRRGAAGLSGKPRAGARARPASTRRLGKNTPRNRQAARQAAATKATHRAASRLGKNTGRTAGRLGRHAGRGIGTLGTRGRGAVRAWNNSTGAGAGWLAYSGARRARKAAAAIRRSRAAMAAARTPRKAASAWSTWSQTTGHGAFAAAARLHQQWTRARAARTAQHGQATPQPAPTTIRVTVIRHPAPPNPPGLSAPAAALPPSRGPAPAPTPPPQRPTPPAPAPRPRPAVIIPGAVIAPATPRALGPGGTTPMRSTMAFPLLAAAEEFSASAARYTPESAHQIAPDLDRLPEVIATLADGIRLYATRIDSEEPVERPVTDALFVLFSGMTHLVALAEEIGPIHRQIHEREIARGEDPRHGEPRWNV